MNKAISNGNRQTETRNAGTMPYVYSPTGSNGLFQTGSTSRYGNPPIFSSGQK